MAMLLMMMTLKFNMCDTHICGDMLCEHNQMRSDARRQLNMKEIGVKDKLTRPSPTGYLSPLTIYPEFYSVESTLTGVFM